MSYDYNNITTKPDLATTNSNGDYISGIHYEVSISLMTDKGILWARWDEATLTLHIEFENELSSEDKTILDNIVSEL